MLGAHAKKEMVTDEKPATNHGKAPSGESGNKKREESPPRVKSHRSGDKKKKIKKIRRKKFEGVLRLLLGLSFRHYSSRVLPMSNPCSYPPVPAFLPSFPNFGLILASCSSLNVSCIRFVP